MNLLLVSPILIPLAAAIISLLARRRTRLLPWIGITGATALLAAALILLRHVWLHGPTAAQLGSWPTPYGITLVADLLAAIMIALSAVVALAVSAYSLGWELNPRWGANYVMALNTLMMGVCGAFLAGDIFNLYVWFEVMLISSFVLLAMRGSRASLAAAIKYVMMNLVSSAIFLAGVGILYGKTGALNMADLAVKLAAEPQSFLVMTSAAMFLTAFGIKAAVFPLFFWLPASYHTPPIAVSAIFAGLLTKVGVYALLRCFTLFFTQNTAFTHGLILILAGLTMATGVLGAMSQNDTRRILSFHIISQIGYMILGLGLMTPLALAGSVFYLIHHIIVKTNLFLIGGAMRMTGGWYSLKKLGGLYGSWPWLGLLFLIPALSLAGIPPLSGFFAKAALIKASLDADQLLLALVALAVGLLTLVSMTKIWQEAFWKPNPSAPETEKRKAFQKPGLAIWAPIAALALLTLLIGFASGPVFALAMRAAEQLLDPQAYIQAVMGEGP